MKAKHNGQCYSNTSDTVTSFLERLKETAPIVFNQPDYDALLMIVRSLFVESSITTDVEHLCIDIHDKIQLHISLCNNGFNASFSSYRTPLKYDFPMQADVRWDYMKVNKPFRLLNLFNMFQYLILKAQENEFIKRFVK
jgi:hypothetical protein